MPHLHTNRPHIGIALSRHEEMLWDFIEAVEFLCADRPSSVRECAQFCGLFVEIHGRERPGSCPVRLTFSNIIIVDKVCTRSSEKIILIIAMDLLSSSSSSKSSSSSSLSMTASTSR